MDSVFYNPEPMTVLAVEIHIPTGISRIIMGNEHSTENDPHETVEILRALADEYEAMI